MNSFFKIKPEHSKYIRWVIGIIILLFGAVFMVVPFIPLGYIFLFAGLFILAYDIPFLKKYIDKLKKKDKKGRLDKVEEKINDGEKKIEDKLVKEKDTLRRQNQYTQR